MVKQFLLQFEYTESTQWLVDESKVADFVASCASESVRYKTDGVIPLTTVFPVQNAEQIIDGKRIIAVELKKGQSR